MAIGSAIQKGTSVSIFDENGKPLAIIHCGNGPEDGLVGVEVPALAVLGDAEVPGVQH